jgi:DNA polymerase III alpha subunit
VVFPDAYDRYEKSVVDGASVLATATLRTTDAEHVELALEELTPLEGIEARRATALRVELDLERFADRETLEQLHELFLRHEGRIQLRLRLMGASWQAEVVPNRVLGVNPTTLVPALTALLGPGKVEYVFTSNGS